MNHVMSVEVFWSAPADQACLVVTKEDGRWRKQLISARKANGLANTIHLLISQNKVYLYPVTNNFGHYGWRAWRRYRP